MAEWEWFDGLDTYGPTGFAAVAAGVAKPEGVALLGGEWNNVLAAGTAVTTAETSCVVVESLLGPGQALRVDFNGETSSSSGGIGKTLGDSYPAVAFGGVFQTDLQNQRKAFALSDGGSTQVAITIETTGRIGVRKGDATHATDGTPLGLSSESVSSFEAFSLAASIVIDNTAGSVVVELNGHEVINLAGVDTQQTLTAAADAVEVWCRGTNSQLAPALNRGTWITLDHMYVHAGSDELPTLALPMVETQFPNADDSIDFAAGSAVLGPTHGVDGESNAPGANQLALRRYTPDADGQLDEVWLLPAATSAAAKFTPAVYADSAGVPGVLLVSGPEVTGCLANVLLPMPLSAGEAVTAGTPIWLGYITDTSIALRESVADGLDGRKAANTYGSGVPSPAPAMSATPQPSWTIFGIVSGVTDDFWSVLDENPAAGDLSFMTSATLNAEDLLIFPNLVSTPTTIYAVKMAALMRRSDGGAREVDLRMKSAGVTGSGATPGLTPSTSYATVASYFAVDPDTLAAWNASGVNLAAGGYKITA